MCCLQAIKHYASVRDYVLMDINSKGEIVCVTENIKDLILAEKSELLKQSIFSLLHTDDHTKIKPLLRNTQNAGWSSGESDKSQYIHARLLIKDSNVTDGARLVLYFDLIFYAFFYLRNKHLLSQKLTGS